jgi:cbb3-type cytochrome oxidase subunit 3
MSIITYVFGGLLVIFLVIAFVYYFSPKRKESIEQPKFTILEEDDEKK